MGPTIVSASDNQPQTWWGLGKEQWIRKEFPEESVCKLKG